MIENPLMIPFILSVQGAQDTIMGLSWSLTEGLIDQLLKNSESL
jgi:hypothetical protein